MEPKIRLNGFEGDWCHYHLSDIGTVSMCRRVFKDETKPEGEIPFFKIGTFGKSPDSYISRELFEDYKEKYPFPKCGDILISAAGTIGRTIEFKGEEAYYQDSNIVWLQHNEDIVNNHFLNLIYQIVRWSGIEGSTIKRLYNNNILNTECYIPNKHEQKEIVIFFRSLDTLIQSTEKKIESLKKVKAASLQSMFPQEGETTPRVRFKGFDGEWVSCIVGELGNWEKGQGLSKSELTDSGAYACIHYGELFNYSECIQKVNSKCNLMSDTLSSDNDILFPDSDVTPTGLGRCSALTQKGIILGGGINILHLKSKYFAPCVSYAINVNNKQIIERVTGTTVRHINAKSLSEVNIKLPKSIEEQQQIANYFTNLDKQIDLQTQRLEKLKQIKAACLDNMFV